MLYCRDGIRGVFRLFSSIKVCYLDSELFHVVCFWV